MDEAVRGVRWTAAARAAAEAVAFAGSIVLARSIPPAEFGRAAAALGIAAIGPALLYQTFGAPLVQAPRLPRDQVRAAALLSLLAGGLLTVVLVLAASPVIGALLGERVGHLALLSVPAFGAAAIASVPRALLQRELAFRWLAIVEVGSLLAGTVTATILATVVGLDGEALVFGFVAATGATMVLSLVRAPWTAPGWRGRGPSAAVLRFGIPAGLSSVVYAMSRTVDYVVLAGRLQPADVGFYWRAFLMGVEYQSKLSVVMLRVGFPVYSRVGSLQEVRRLRVRVMAMHAAVLFPLLATLFVTAPVLIPWLFGDRWEPSVVPTQILVGAGLAVTLITGTGPFLLAIGRPQPLLVYNLGALVGLGMTAYVSAPLGLNGVAVAVLAFYVVLLLANHYFLLHRIGGIPGRDLWSEVVPPLVSCLPLVAVTFPLVRALEGEVPVPLILLAATLFGFATYLLTLRLVFPGAWRGLRSVLARVLGLDLRARRTV